jgi:hypothetical protein
LLGIDQRAFDAILATSVKDYLSTGGIDRFIAPATASGASSSARAPAARIPAAKSLGPKSPPSPPSPPPPAAAWLDQKGSDEAVERLLQHTHSQRRNRKIAADIRMHYQHRCMFCDIQLEIADNRFYAEAAHIKPLGSPHNGPDKTGNLLVLCPNHHLQFDTGMLRLVPEGTAVKLKSSIKGDALNGKLITTRHTLDMSCVNYHHDWHEPTGR